LTPAGKLAVAGNATVHWHAILHEFQSRTLTASTVNVLRMRGCCDVWVIGDSLVDWAAKVPFLQKEIQAIDHGAI
jgi:hypothetical protein